MMRDPSVDAKGGTFGSSEEMLPSTRREQHNVPAAAPDG